MNFRDLDELIHSGVKEIFLDSDFILDDAEESDYKEGIELDIDDLVIDGNNHTIDAKGKVRIFLCRGKNITIKNITLKNGFAHDGGAICNSNNCVLTINDSILTQNTAQKYGGAVYNDHGHLIIIKSALSGNTAVNGGAIDNMGNVTISDSTFSGNTAVNGGAIYNYYGSKLIITDSEITQNIAQISGGAIYKKGGDLTITDSAITENISHGDGGAIRNTGTLTITNSVLNKNTKVLSNYSGGNLKIFKCEISSNKSNNELILNKGYLEIYNSHFKDNHSKYILINEYGEYNISIIDGEFIDNTVEEAIIFNNGSSFTIQNTVFNNSLSQNNSNNIINKTDLTLRSPKIKNEGKTILNEGHIFIQKTLNVESKIYGDGTVENDILPQEIKNDFGYLDKIIHENNTKEIILNEDICFENYERDYYEGGIELDVDDLVIDGNDKTIDGAGKSRIFIITGKNITLKNITFKNGYSHDNYYNLYNASGGAIRVNFNNNLTIENCKFINNISERNGGAIDNKNGRLTVKKSTFSHNMAQNGDGGVICHPFGELIITQSILAENTAKDNGGAIYKPEGELIITQSTLTENTSDSGGAIYLSKFSINYESENCTFKDNKPDDVYGDSITPISFKPYEGLKPFVFVSYNREDYKKIYPLINKLHNAGINIWYVDIDMAFENDYDIKVAEFIRKSSLFVTFITESLIKDSNNPQDYNVKELMIGISTGKKCLPIFIDEVELDGFYLMHYLNKQSIFKYEYGENEDLFIEHCISVFKQFGIEPKQ